MNSMDLSLKEAGFKHLRYVDDIRVFCSSEIGSKSALLRLTQILRRRGLNLQSAKTEILQSNAAQQNFEGVIPVLKNIEREFIEKLTQEAGIINTYITIAEADKLALEDFDTEESAEVLRNAFTRLFVDATAKFDSSLFRFIINRLRAKKDDFCRDYCFQAIIEHPEETSHILKYLGSIRDIERSFAGLVAFFGSGHAIYDYQIYQIFEWLTTLKEPPSERLKTIARDIGFDNARPSYLRAVCRRLIGSFPSVSDLERIESSYAAARMPLEMAQILCDLRGVEPGRRNSFLGRAQRDHPMCRRAVELVKSKVLLGR